MTISRVRSIPEPCLHTVPLSPVLDHSLRCLFCDECGPTCDLVKTCGDRGPHGAGFNQKAGLFGISKHTGSFDLSSLNYYYVRVVPGMSEVTTASQGHGSCILCTFSGFYSCFMNQGLFYLSMEFWPIITRHLATNRN